MRKVFGKYTESLEGGVVRVRAAGYMQTWVAPRKNCFSVKLSTTKGAR